MAHNDTVFAGATGRCRRRLPPAYCQGTPLRGEIEARDGARMPLAIERATDAIARGARDAPVAGKIQAYLMVARR